MSNYTKNTNFTAKDALSSGDPLKKILGSLFDSEFDEIATAIASKEDSANKNAANGYAGLSASTLLAAAQLPAATDTAQGAVELATSAEVVTGTDTTRATTAAGVAAKVADYAPAKAGTNATGTWGISISGNAATATSATTAGSATSATSATTASAVPASGITGTTLAANVTASSLTSFGSSIALGTPGSGNLANCTFPTLNQSTSGNAATATTAGTLTGLTSTIAELNFTDGVTSAIQTQLDAKLASSSYTAADVLSKLLTVDGAASGLDADLLDGQSSAAFAAASHAHSGSDITSGTVAKARIDADVYRGTLGSANITIQSGGSASGGSNGDIWFIV